MSALTSKSLFPMMVVSGILGYLPTHAYAFLPNDSFLPPCDIRQLNLSKEQQGQLRSLRVEHRQILDRVGKQNRSLERSRRQNIIRILSSASFDETQASRYVADHYQAKSRFAVEELGVQHKIYRLLTPEQQKIWVETCVR